MNPELKRFIDNAVVPALVKRLQRLDDEERARAIQARAAHAPLAANEKPE